MRYELWYEGMPHPGGRVILLSKFTRPCANYLNCPYLLTFRIYSLVIQSPFGTILPLSSFLSGEGTVGAIVTIPSDTKVGVYRVVGVAHWQSLSFSIFGGNYWVEEEPLMVEGLLPVASTLATWFMMYAPAALVSYFGLAIAGSVAMIRRERKKQAAFRRL